MLALPKALGQDLDALAAFCLDGKEEAPFCQ